MTLDEFDLVGITPRLDKFVAQIIKKPAQANFKATQINYIAHKPNYEELGITPQMIERFKEVNAEDYENYRWAVELSS